MKNLFRLSVILLLIIFSCEKKTNNDDEILIIEDLLIKNGEITGWTYSGSGWTVNNISELTMQINGAAVLYERYGFIEATYQAYQGNIDDSNSKIELYIYKLGSSENASSLFNDPDLETSSGIVWSDNQAGTEAKYMRYGGFSQVLNYYRDQYFVSLSVTYDTEESLNILKQFAFNIDEKIK